MNTVVAEQQANPFGSRAIAERGTNAVAETDQARAVAETQAAMIIAKRFPRDQIAAMDRILQACSRPTLAEQALYTYGRGGTEITGPSIRMAEALAQNWGNISFGIRELEQRNGESSVEAFAWDIETNTRQTKTFQVPHKRFTKKGSYALEDPRDIYEMVANQGARRLRACILGVIPGDVIEAAVEQCEKTLHAKVDITPELIKTLLDKFAEYAVSKEHIEKRIQRRIESIAPAQVVQLRKIYNSIKDGMSTPAEWFEIAPVVEGTDKPVTGASALKAAVAKKPAAVNTDTGEITGNSMDGGEDPTLGIPGAGNIEHVGAPQINYEALLQQLQNASSVEVLETAATLIGAVDGMDRQNSLAEFYKKRREELTAPKKGK